MFRNILACFPRPQILRQEFPRELYGKQVVPQGSLETAWRQGLGRVRSRECKLSLASLPTYLVAPPERLPETSVPADDLLVLSCHLCPGGRSLTYTSRLYSGPLQAATGEPGPVGSSPASPVGLQWSGGGGGGGGRSRQLHERLSG